MPTKRRSELPKSKTTHKPKTKVEKKIAKQLEKEFKYSNNTAKRRPAKTAPTVLFVNKDARTLIPVYANSSYDPEYLALGYEYLKICYESFARRERFYATNFTNSKTGKLIIPREEMDDKDRYVPFVRLPTILDFIVFCAMEKKKLITVEKIETYAETDIEFKQMISLIKTSTESFMQQLPANNQGQTRMYEFLLKNNFGYKGDEGGGNTNNIGIFQQIYNYIGDKKKEDKAIEGTATDIDYQLLDQEKHGK